MRGTSPTAPFEATLAFSEADGGTRVDALVEFDAKGPMRFFIGPFARWYGKSWNQGMANLKRLMESGEL